MPGTTAAVREAALETLVTLMGQGYAGLDQYDDTRFVVDAPEPFLTEGEQALDELGASFLRTSALGVKPRHVAALLRNRDFLALGLDSRDAPRIAVPLASRRADATVSQLMTRAIDDVASVAHATRSSR